MQQINVEDNQKSKQNKGDIFFLVLISIALLLPTLFGLIIYSLPKFLISKFLLKKQDQKYKIVLDTALAGLILGVLSLVGAHYNPHSNTIRDADVAIEDWHLKNSTDEKIDGNYYKNTKYHFGINFPDGWEIKDSTGLHMVIKAINQYASISIGVIPEIDDAQTITEILPLKDLIKNTEEEYRPQYPDYRLIDSGETKIDNLPAYFVTADVENTTVHIRLSVYELFYNNRLYFISLVAEHDKYEESKKLFEKSLSTFMIDPS